MRKTPAGGATTPLPRGIWALGLVSLFMDVSSEMVHSLLPVFVVGTLGASVVFLGIIEGVGEAAASFVKLLSGRLSDRIRSRKGLTVIGYAVGALSKPLFALAPSAAWVFGARVSDRIGKGIRGAPRDALVADLTPAPLRGAAYGLRQALDTVGALLGPLIAMAMMTLLAADVRTVFWAAVVPGTVAVLILVVGVREPGLSPAATEKTTDTAQPRALGRSFWIVVGIGALLTLARFSEAFLVLRASENGLTLGMLPLVLVVLNLTYSASAYPAGKLSDRLNRRVVLGWGTALLMMAQLVLAGAQSWPTVLAGVAVWGLHLGLSQSLVLSLVADTVPAERRGTAFGTFHFINGFAILASGVIAGTIWEVMGPAATFLYGAAAALLTLLALWLAAPPRRSMPA